MTDENGIQQIFVRYENFHKTTARDSKSNKQTIKFSCLFHLMDTHLCLSLKGRK